MVLEPELRSRDPTSLYVPKRRDGGRFQEVPAIQEELFEQIVPHSADAGLVQDKSTCRSMAVSQKPMRRRRATFHGLGWASSPGHSPPCDLISAKRTGTGEPGGRPGAPGKTRILTTDPDSRLRYQGRHAKLGCSFSTTILMDNAGFVRLAECRPRRRASGQETVAFTRHAHAVSFTARRRQYPVAAH